MTFHSTARAWIASSSKATTGTKLRGNMSRENRRDKDEPQVQEGGEVLPVAFAGAPTIVPPRGRTPEDVRSRRRRAEVVSAVAGARRFHSRRNVTEAAVLDRYSAAERHR